MPKPHPGRKSFLDYLKNEFPWEKDWDARDIFVKDGKSKNPNKKSEDYIFSYIEVKEALKRLARTDPTLYKYLNYWWLTHRTLSEISRGLDCDPSTFKRNSQKGVHTVINYLINEDVTLELESLDLVDNYYA